MYFRKGVHELALQGFSYNTLPFVYYEQYNVIGEVNVFNALRYNYHLNHHWSLRSAFSYTRAHGIVYIYDGWAINEKDIKLMNVDCYLGGQYTFALPKTQLYVGMELGAGNFSLEIMNDGAKYNQFQAAAGLVTGFRYFLSKSFSLRMENTLHYVFTRETGNWSLAQLMLAYHFQPQRDKSAPAR